MSILAALLTIGLAYGLFLSLNKQDQKTLAEHNSKVEHLQDEVKEANYYTHLEDAEVSVDKLINRLKTLYAAQCQYERRNKHADF